MTAGWVEALVVAGVALALYAAFVGLLAASGRREEARAVARLVPDCARLAAGLARDPRVPRSRRLALAALALYLASPIDLVPDMVPVVGLLDDALLVLLVLRGIVRAAGAEVLADHWPGSPRTLELLLRAAAR
jgi:uncharacterized membrane protein YkvA (DUF1232 family)